ncbi:uncharacterized protein LOC132269024 isoform X3 [Cornus florida]|uniref:uncharacterized protein LOC132269024 isoform X3 n=1 Tax=Cornus florida TaxID=4283 RepID=UPI00289E3F4F|nr:uncharacterized protein LOC132269024 isoform X3 [Cornus florida]
MQQYQTQLKVNGKTCRSKIIYSTKGLGKKIPQEAAGLDVVDIEDKVSSHEVTDTEPKVLLQSPEWLSVYLTDTCE